MMKNMAFSRARAVAAIFSLSIHAIVLLVFFYRSGQYLPIINLPQIQTISLILPMPPEKRRLSPPVKVAGEKTAINRETSKNKEAGTSVAPAKEIAPDNREEITALPSMNEKEDKTAPPSMNEKEDKTAPQAIKVQADDAGVADFREKDKRAGELNKGVPVVLSSGQERAQAAPLASHGPFAGSSVKGKTGEGDSISQVTGKGKATEGSTFTSGHAQMDTPGERASFPVFTGGEAASGGGLVVAAPRYGENSLPAYPILARRRGYAGIVMLSVEVLTDGTVGHIEVKKTSGYDLLDRSALEAVKGWKFLPAKKAGLPVIMRVDVPVRFSLN